MECAVLKQIESYMAACRLDEFLQDTELTQERITAPLKEKSPCDDGGEVPFGDGFPQKK